jgi:hypothetical protein
MFALKEKGGAVTRRWRCDDAKLSRTDVVALRRLLSDEYLHQTLRDQVISRDHLCDDIVSDLIRKLSSANCEKRLRRFQKLRGLPVSTELKDGDVRVRYNRIVADLRAIHSELRKCDQSDDELLVEIQREIETYSSAFDDGIATAGIKIQEVQFPIKLTHLLAIEWQRDQKALRKLLFLVFKRWRNIDDPRSKSATRFLAHDIAADIGHDRSKILAELEGARCVEGGTNEKIDTARKGWIGQFNSRDLNQARAHAVQIVAAHLERTKHINERTGQKLLLETIERKRRKAVSRWLDELTDGRNEPLLEERVKRDFIRFEVEARADQV